MFKFVIRNVILVLIFSLCHVFTAYGKSILDEEIPFGGDESRSFILYEMTYSARNEEWINIGSRSLDMNMSSSVEYDRTEAMFITNRKTDSGKFIFISIDEMGVSYTDVVAEIVDDRVFVPLRFIVENLYKPYNTLYGDEDFSLDVRWNEKTQTVTVPNEFKHVIGTSYITYSDGIRLDIGVNSYIRDGRTMVSIRLIGEALGCDVSWDNDNRQVNILSPWRLAFSEAGEEEWFRLRNAIGRMMPGFWDPGSFFDWTPPTPVASGELFKDYMVPELEQFKVSDTARWYGDKDKDAAIVSHLLRLGRGTYLSNNAMVKYLCRGDMYWALDLANIGRYNGYEIIPSDREFGDISRDEGFHVIDEDPVYVILECNEPDGYYFPIDVLYKDTDGRFYTDYNQDYIPYSRRNSEQFNRVIEEYLSTQPPAEQKRIRDYLEWSKTVE
jgi:hypothetical protein